jgi:DNA-binding Xre family transcriptional regulator
VKNTSSKKSNKKITQVKSALELKRTIEERNLTYVEAANELGLAEKQLARILAGRFDAFMLDELSRLNTVLKTAR